MNNISQDGWNTQVDGEDPILPSVEFKNCPIRASLGVLGKKWTLLILRDIAFLKIQRFNKILRSLPGLTPRVLIMRLNELEKDQLIRSVVIQKKPKLVRWILTEKGRDTVPILMSFISFGARWLPDIVFEDKRVRSVKEIFPELPTIKIR